MISSTGRGTENIKSSAEPEINQYQAQKRSPLILKILFGGVILVLLGLVAFKLQGLFSSEKEVEKVDSRLQEGASSSSRKRRDLGQFTSNEDASPAPPVNDVVIVDPQPRALPPVKQVFKKYLSIPLQGSSSASSPVAEATKPEFASQLAIAAVAAADVEATPRMKVEAITMDPNLFIEANTYIPCSLQTRFVSDIAGTISCVISQDVYSANSHTKLIEKGTKAFGSYRTGTLKHGQGRMFVIWTQLRTPDFKKISLVDTQVVGQLGEAGIEGWIDTHFLERFGNALMLSLVQDVAAAVAKTSIKTNSNTDYTANSRESLAKMANTTLENSINIPPTLYKNQGDVLGIMVGEDIDFSGIYALRVKK